MISKQNVNNKLLHFFLVMNYITHNPKKSPTNRTLLCKWQQKSSARTNHSQEALWM